MNKPSARGISRREFLRRSTMLAAAGFLAACSSQVPQPQPAPAEGESPGGAAAPAKEGVTLQYWVGWGELTPFFDKFKELPEYKELLGDVNVELKPSVATEALLTAVASGTPPDMTSEAPYLDLMARGVLAPLEELVAGSSIIKKEDFIEGNWEAGKYQGKLYGIPALECFVRYGLNYNTRMVEAAGLDPENPPVTWQEALEWHKELTKFDDAGNLLQIGLDPYDAEGGAVGDGFYATRSWGFEWFNEETGEFNLDNEMMAEAFDVMGEFYRIAGPDNIAGMRSVEGQDTWGGSYNAEVQAMIIEGYWHPGETAIQKPEVAKYNRATWAPVPENRRGVKVQGTGGHYVVIFKESKHIPLSFKFAEFLNTKSAMELVFKEVGWLPAYIPFIESADPSAYPGLEWYFKSVKEADEIRGPARCPITAFVQDTYNQLREEVYRDNMTAAAAAAEFQKRCVEEYKAAGFAG
ncbi:MAG: extracellular solute-binding protein [Chloroflexi bacterium]|nr:MAG: extracellular solute-binding protein [Chloroflexota bacterium]